MRQGTYTIRDAKPEEYDSIGQLMVNVYRQLEGFPKPEEQPKYYHMLANIGEVIKRPESKLLVAISDQQMIAGGVVYFGNMQYYGSGGTASSEQAAGGFRLLAVDPQARGVGLGRRLSEACIAIAKDSGKKKMVIHSTKAMSVAWTMYEGMGFRRAPDLDFMQENLSVYGFRLEIES